MATAGKGEHFWFQIMVRATINDGWKQQSRERIDKLLKIERYKKEDEEVKTKKAKEGDIKEQKGSMLNLTPEQKKEVEIVSKNLEKDGLDCFIRFYGLKYKNDHDKMSVSKNILPIVYGMKPFDNVGYNSFKFNTITTDSDYPDLDPKSLMSNKKKKRFGKTMRREPVTHSKRKHFHINHGIYGRYIGLEKKLFQQMNGLQVLSMLLHTSTMVWLKSTREAWTNLS